MLLTLRDKQNIVKTFPITELYYAKNIHNKVYKSDFYLIIPKGTKYFAWFRQYKGNNICIILELQNNKEIADITFRRCCFDATLCAGNGTILFGTIFSKKGFSFFIIEDLYYFKDKNTQPFSQIKRLNLIHNILKYHTKKLLLPTNGIDFNLALVDTNYETIVAKANRCPYTPWYLQHRCFARSSGYLNQIFQPTHSAIFMIMAACMPDIYKLFCYSKDKTLTQHGYLHIPSYKSSVMMNELFREIKENRNLDALEESDDEDEFQDVSPSKYVNLEKKYIMKCVYIKRFKRWEPLEVSPNASISKIKDIAIF